MKVKCCYVSFLFTFILSTIVLQFLNGLRYSFNLPKHCGNPTEKLHVYVMMYKDLYSYISHTVCRVGGGEGVMTGVCWASTSPDALVELCIQPNGREWSVLCALS